MATPLRPRILKHSVDNNRADISIVFLFRNTQSSGTGPQAVVEITTLSYPSEHASNHDGLHIKGSLMRWLPKKIPLKEQTISTFGSQ
jgi:hypothetical protein